MKIRTLLCLVLLPFALTTFAQQSFDDETDFLNAIEADFFFEDFSSISPGPAVSISFGPVNGYSYTVSSAPGSTSDLFNDPGVISLDNAGDQLRFTFTGAPVTAFGGNIFATDISFNPITATMTITLDDGSSFSFATSTSTTFAGWVSDGTPIAFIDIDADAGATNAWPSVASFYVGTASDEGEPEIPEAVAVPTLSAAGLWLTIALALMLGLFMLRRTGRV